MKNHHCRFSLILLWIVYVHGFCSSHFALRNMVGWLKRTVCWLDRFLLVWNFRFYGTFVRTVRSVLVKRNLPKDIFAHTRIGNGEGLKDWLRLTISLICSDFFLFFFSARRLMILKKGKDVSEEKWRWKVSLITFTRSVVISSQVRDCSLDF